jgi:hypothetical protein
LRHLEAKDDTNPNQNIDDTQQIIKKTTPVEATLPLPPGFETGPIKENISDATLDWAVFIAIVLLLITFINHSKKSLPSSVSNQSTKKIMNEILEIFNFKEVKFPHLTGH